VSHFICTTCGTQYPESDVPPAECTICQDDRQYVNPDGQQWTTLEQLRAERHNEFTDVEPGLTAIRSNPTFAIAQQAYLIETPSGNVLWDCISLVDDKTVEAIQARGGLTAMAISHPHFYSSMVEWSCAFNGIPIYLHTSDQQWVMRPYPSIVWWDDETYEINDQITLIRCGGHFPGSTALHWADGAGGKGVLLTADTLMVIPTRHHVTFMYSFPNVLPLPASKVRGVANAVEPYAFDCLYSAWPDRVIQSGAKQTVRDSAEHYIRLLREE
jgi:hypothetical protein